MGKCNEQIESNQLEINANFVGIPYTIHVTTSDVTQAGTSARVYLIMYGGKVVISHLLLLFQNIQQTNPCSKVYELSDLT